MKPEEFYQRLQEVHGLHYRTSKEAVRPIFPSISGME